VRLGLLAIVRDEAGNLPHLLARLEQLERSSAVEMLWCSFYENDSSDDTPVQLARWLERRSGVLISEQLGVPRLQGRLKARTERLAWARNRALEPLLAQSLDLLLVVDADLDFTVEQVMQLISVLRGHDTAVMACASALQNVPDLFGHGPSSYYDTFALLDRGGRRGITHAAVPVWTLEDRAAWLAGRPVPVMAAFGGMAVLRMATVHQLNLRWNGEQGCEHWAFCIAAGQAGSVLACPGINPRIWHDRAPQWTLAYRDQRRHQLRSLWHHQLLHP